MHNFVITSSNGTILSLHTSNLVASNQLTVTSTFVSPQAIVKVINETMDTDETISLTIGKASTTNNAGVIKYSHITDDSTNNQIQLGTFGNPSTLCVSKNSIGILTTVPEYPLHVGAQTDSVSIYSVADIVSFSDIRKKVNISPIEDALKKVEKLTGYTFNHIDNVLGSRMAGVIAQELLGVFPEVVKKDCDGFFNVAYGNISALLINAIKELKKDVDEIKLYLGLE